MTLNEVCAKARQFETRSVREYWTWLGLLGFLIVGMTVHFVRLSEPMIRIGIASLLSIFLYMVVRMTRNGPPRRLRAGAQSDTCVNFLRAELNRKREALLEFRWTGWLLLPGMFAVWWSGGFVAISKGLGVSRPWMTSYQESPAPLVLVVALVVAGTLLNGKEARAIQREIEELGSEPPRS